MGMNGTDFRYVATGRQPGDWNIIWDPSGDWSAERTEIDPWRETYLDSSSTSSSGIRSALVWSAPESDPTGHANQDLQLKLRWRGSDCDTGGVRLGGAAGAENGYVLRLESTSGLIKIDKLVNGVRTNLAAVAFSFPEDTANLMVYARLRANGTSITARAWVEGTTEPGTWPASATDSAIADGYMGIVNGASLTDGLVLGAGARVHFFSYATNGGTAPSPSFLPQRMEDWLRNPEIQVNFTAEIESYNPVTEQEETIWISKKGLFTRADDFPSSIEMPSFLNDPGQITAALSEDSLFSGQAEESFGTMVANNPQNRLGKRLLGKTLDGRNATVRIGLAGWTDHRWYEVVYSGRMDGEPSIEPQISISFQDPYKILEDLIKVGRYRGIETGLSLNSCVGTSTWLAVYDLTSFSVTWEFCFSSPPASHAGISKGSGSAENWAVWIETDGTVVARSSIGGQPKGIYLRSAEVYTDGAFHRAVYAVDGTNRAYLMIDDEVVAEMAHSDLVDTPAVGISIGTGFTGQKLFDVRYYNYALEEDEARSVTATRCDNDAPGVVALYRCDDGIGNIVTDYSGGNNITLPGTINVNFTWIATYLGNSSFTGTMPYVDGKIINAEAQKIDPNREIYRFNDKALPVGSAVFKAKGLQLVGGGVDYTDHGNGTVEMVSSQSQPVTFDVTYPGSSRSIFQLDNVLGRMITDRIGLDKTTYDPHSVERIGRLTPYEVQVVISQETKGADAISPLLSGTGNHLRLDSYGRIVVDTILPPLTPGPYSGDKVLEFSGVSGSRVVFTGPSLGSIPKIGSFAIGFWVKSFLVDRDNNYTTKVATHGLLNGGTVASRNGTLLICLNGAGQGGVGFFVQGRGTVTSPNGIVKWGVWTLIYYVYDSSAGTISIYAGSKGSNLTKVFSQTGVSATSHSDTSLLELGGRAGTLLDSVPGSVAHFQIWNRTLSLDEMKGMMLSAPSTSNPNLTFYAPMTEGKGRTVTEAISGAKGTIDNARWCPRRIYDFNSSLSASTFKVKRLRPAWNALVKYWENNKPLTDADIASVGVSQAQRIDLKRKLRTRDAPSTKIKTDYPAARLLQIPQQQEAAGPIVNDLHAQRLVRTMMNRFAPGEVLGSLEEIPRAGAGLMLGDEVWVLHPDFLPFNASGGAFRIISYSPNLASLRASMDLWGMPLEPFETAILVNDFTELNTDSGQPLVTG